MGEVQYARLRDSRDAETGLQRAVEPPAARRYRARAAVSVAPAAADDRLDRLAGYRGAVAFTSSGRFQGRPGHRASRAFDAAGGAGWIGERVGRRPAWVAWRAPELATVTALRLGRPPAAIPHPVEVRLRVGGSTTPALAVGPGGRVRLPRPLRGRRFRLEVIRSAGGRRGVRAVGIGRISGAGVPSVRVPRAGRLDSSCADLVVVARPAADRRARRLGLRVGGTVADMDAGAPLTARGCGRLALPAGPARVSVPATALAPDILRLDSPAPRPPTAAARGGGRVLDPGDEHDGRRSGARLRVDGPSWLILGESHNRGWRANCDGRDLGEPTPIDGYANGWRVDRDCSEVDFAFAPGRVAAWAGIAAGLACLVLLALLVARRAGRRVDPLEAGFWPAYEPPALRLSGRAAIGVGLAAAAVLGFMFALRAGAVLGPLLGLLLWRGARPKELALAAGALLAVVVPAIYVMFPPTSFGGANSSYAADLLGAHWVAAGAVTLLGLALVLTLAERRPRRAPGRG